MSTDFLQIQWEAGLHRIIGLSGAAELQSSGERSKALVVGGSHPHPMAFPSCVRKDPCWTLAKMAKRKRRKKGEEGDEPLWTLWTFTKLQSSKPKTATWTLKPEEVKPFLIVSQTSGISLPSEKAVKPLKPLRFLKPTEELQIAGAPDLVSGSGADWTTPDTRRAPERTGPGQAPDFTERGTSHMSKEKQPNVRRCLRRNLDWDFKRYGGWQLAAVRLPPGPGREWDVVHRLNLKCSDRAILAERCSRKKKSEKNFKKNVRGNVKRTIKRHVNRNVRWYVRKRMSKRMSKHMSEEKSEDMSKEMFDDVSEKNVRRNDRRYVNRHVRIYVRQECEKKICQKRMSERMSKEMSQEMSEDMSIEMLNVK